MRRTFAIALCLLFVPLSAGAEQDLAGHRVTGTYDFENGAQGWVSTGTPSNKWVVRDISTSHAFKAGTQTSYSADVATQLTSPVLPLRGGVLGLVSYEYAGSSGINTSLQLQIKAELPSNSPWVPLSTHTGPLEVPERTEVDVTEAAIAAGFGEDRDFKLRFVFTSAADPPAGFGWIVDNVTVAKDPYVLNQITDLLSSDFQTSGWIESPDTGDDRFDRRQMPGSSNAAYFAGHQPSLLTPMYNDAGPMAIYSPVIDTSGHRVRAIQFTLAGSSHADSGLLLENLPIDLSPVSELLSLDEDDYLEVGYAAGVLPRTSGGTVDYEAMAWTPVGAFAGTALKDNAVRFELKDPDGFALLHANPFSRDLVVGFRFVTNTPCDSNAPPGDDVEAQIACADFADLQGWFVDNVNVQAYIDDDGPVPGPADLVFVYPDPNLESVRVVDPIVSRLSVIGFDIDQTAADPGQEWDSAFVALQRPGGETRTYTLQKQEIGGHTHWVAPVPVSDPELLLMTHGVRFVAVRADDSIVAFAAGNLRFEADDTKAPVLSTAEPPIILRAQSAVRLEIIEPLIRSVTVDLPAAPGTRLSSPYLVHANVLPEGPTNLTFRVEDRGQRASTLTVPVIKDTMAPVVEVDVPDRIYAGVPFTWTLGVTDGTNTTVTTTFNGTTRDHDFDPGDPSKDTITTLRELGEHDLLVTARDAAGHSAEASYRVVVERATADIELRSVAVGDGPFIAGDDVVLSAIVGQTTGIVDVRTRVTFADDFGERSKLVTVPSNGSSSATITTDRIPPGRQAITVTAVGDEDVTELDETNQEKTLFVEIFLGRVDYGRHSYYIRASTGFGLPLEAVHLPTNTTYPLQVPDQINDRVYRFDVMGETLEWDPLHPVSDHEPEEEDTPTPWLLPALALLGAAFARRR